MGDNEASYILKKRMSNLRRRLHRFGSGYIRVVTSAFGKKRALPDFLIIGAMKCGTSSLFHYLQQHPGISGPSIKEVHFLNNPRFYRFGEPWYRSHFPTLQAMDELSNNLGYQVVTGEGTPAMISNFYAINAGKHLPNARLVVVLRDPVDRAYSHYHHMCRSFAGEPLSFWDALQAEEKRTAADIKLNWEQPEKAGAQHKRYAYAKRGMYIDQIEYWLKYFPREQLKFLHFDDLVSRPGEVCNAVCDFMELPNHEFDTREMRNPGHYTEPMGERCREYLTEQFRPYNRRLFEFLGEDWGWPSEVRG